MRITFRKHRETGLAAVASTGSDKNTVSIDGVVVGSVDLFKPTNKYFWYANGRNTFNEKLFFSDLSDAKADCKKWLKENYKP